MMMTMRTSCLVQLNEHLIIAIASYLEHWDQYREAFSKTLNRHIWFLILHKANPSRTS